jgi:hypothetical protein
MAASSSSFTDDLKTLKGNAKVKEYKDQPDGYLEYNGWIFTYCVEKTPFNFQKTLCISRVDKVVFNLGDIPVEVWPVFTEKFALMSSHMYAKRGYSLVFIFIGETDL